MAETRKRTSQSQQRTGGPGGRKRIERPQNAGKTLTRILGYVMRYKFRLIIAAV